ncbi:hypothetical protein G4G28_06780 [Massilia sp. Dwa41.01b]|nr:hypothetical protein G4G28_06780 [Massilia sp. Dwa41.01b]
MWKTCRCSPALALCWVLAGAQAREAALLFSAYVGLRYLHTGALLAALQPWRALLYPGSLGVLWTIAVRLALRVLGT